MNCSKLAQLPTDRQARWNLIRSFAEEWGRRPNGFPLADLEQAEQRLGFKLPKALREWYGLMGTWPEDYYNGNYLLAPHELTFDLEDPEWDTLTFYVENQSTAWWGIRRTDLHRDDPPVVVYIEGDETDFKESNSLSEFMVSVIFFAILLSCSFGGYAPITPATITILTEQYQQVHVPDWHWPVYPTRFFCGSNTLIMLHGEDEPSIFIGARTASALAELEVMLGVKVGS